MNWYNLLKLATNPSVIGVTVFRGINPRHGRGLALPGETHYTARKRTAEEYAWHPDGGGSVEEKTISIMNPAPNDVQRQVREQFDKNNIVTELIRRGYDGHIVGDEYVVYN